MISDLEIRSFDAFLYKFRYKIFKIGNFNLQGQRLFFSSPSLSVRLGSTFFPRGVQISRELNTGGVLISQEISTGGVLIFGEYLFSVTPDSS